MSRWIVCLVLTACNQPAVGSPATGAKPADASPTAGTGMADASTSVAASSHAVAPEVVETSQATEVRRPTTQRCERAGGRCVGMAAVRANPMAPCPAGMHRVDDVTLTGEATDSMAACYGIPLGEAACCMADAAVTAPR